MEYKKAKETLKNYLDKMNKSSWCSKDEKKAMEVAISTLGAINQYKWERDIAVEQLKELGLELGEKCEMTTRSFSVRADCEELIGSLGNKLDEELIDLQNKGWKIISVESVPCKEYRYPKYFDSTLFVIIAQHN